MAKLTKYLVKDFLTIFFVAMLLITFAFSVGAIYKAIDIMAKGFPVGIVGRFFSLDTPQADWFGDDVNMILRFENLHEDFDKIKNILHCSKDLAIINANTTYDYRTLYDDDLVEIVRDIYIKDVIKYGYEYEI